MKNPKIVQPLHEGATYALPTYKVIDGQMTDGEGMHLKFCKGDKSNSSIFRQEGVFTETLIQVSKQYLESVNKGEMATRETSMAITKLDEALMWIDKRRQDRELRGVAETYQK